MKFLKTLICAILLLTLTACEDRYEIIDQTELVHTFIVNSSPNFKGYFYEGSDSEFHFFSARWDFWANNHFKVNKGTLKLKPVLARGVKEIRVDVIQTNTVFSKSEHLNLYVEE